MGVAASEKRANRLALARPHHVMSQYGPCRPNVQRITRSANDAALLLSSSSRFNESAAAKKGRPNQKDSSGRQQQLFQVQQRPGTTAQLNQLERPKRANFETNISRGSVCFLGTE